MRVIGWWQDTCWTFSRVSFTPSPACAAAAQRAGLGPRARPCSQRAHAEGSRDSGGCPGHPDRPHRLHGGLLKGPGAPGLLCSPGPATGGTGQVCTLSCPAPAVLREGCTTFLPEGLHCPRADQACGGTLPWGKQGFRHMWCTTKSLLLACAPWHLTSVNALWCCLAGPP